jgi:fructose-bisphosphate aldolase class 1
MPTRIKATAPFSNDRYLAHLDENRVERGQEVEVADRYAERVVEKEIAEIVEPEDGAEWALGEHKASGYYYALYDGERVEDGDGFLTVGQGEDDARAEVERMNEEEVTPTGK